jgi:hypothetical protein
VSNRSRFNCRSRSFAFSLAIPLLACSPGASSAEDGKPSVQASAVPAIEALPHVALPRGTFKAWCGRNDRFLLEVDGQLEAYDAGTKYATIAVSSSWPAQCGLDGTQLVYVDSTMGYLIQVDIASGNSRLLAVYKPAPGVISPVPSPDLKTVATVTPMTLAPEAGALKVFTVKQNEKAHIIKWNDDSSKLLIGYSATAQVLDSNGAMIGSGPFPKRTYFEDEWFTADSNFVLLYLSPKEKRAESVLVKCRINVWKCDRLQSRLEAVSVGGRGVIGTIVPLGKPPPPSGRDEEDPFVFEKYVVELRNDAFTVLARQVLLTAGGNTEYEIKISPSGKKAVLTWHAEPGANCTPLKNSSYCERGMLVDISRVLR